MQAHESQLIPDLLVPSPRRTTFTLARTEGRRLLRHPLVLVGMELSIYLYVRTITSGPMPVGPRVDVQISSTMLPLATASLLAANLATLRSRRHGMEELYETLPMPSAHRTAAHVLAVAAPVGLAALTVFADLALFWIVLGGVGAPNPFELVAGPAMVALAGALGVLLARLAPWFGTAPITVVGLAMLWYLPYLLFRTTHQVWVRRSFWTFPWYGAPGSPADWVDPFAGAWHLAYITGLAALTACLAVGLSSNLRRHRTQTVVAMTLVVALTATSAVVQAPPASAAKNRELERARVAIGSPASQACRTDREVRYCAWPAYLPWIERLWKQPIDGVLRRLPPTENRGVLRVRQMELGDFARCLERSACEQQEIRSAIQHAFADSDVRPGGSWPRDTPSQGKAELALASSAAAWAVGMTTAPTPDSETLTVCMPRGARVVVALWLAGQSTRLAEASLRASTGDPASPQESRLRDRMTLRGGATTPQWPWQEAAYAVRLLDRPPAEVAAQLQRDWARWTSAGTSTESLAEAFGLPSPARDSTTGFEVDRHTDCNRER